MLIIKSTGLGRNESILSPYEKKQNAGIVAVADIRIFLQKRQYIAFYVPQYGL